jgi:tetratricopeptide (TPR) repeat protein
MRTPLLRTTLRGIVVLGFMCALATPALAQSVVRGKVTDAQGKPVPDATVDFASTDSNRKTSTKTDKNGEFLQVGLQSGGYKVTASKQGIGSQTKDAQVKQGPSQINFTISAASAAATPENKAEAAAINAAATAGIDALKSGKNDEAIAKFNEVIAKVPTCADCYFNIAMAYQNQQKYAEAETAYKKVLELKPDSADAYTGLATIYNAQKKFDLAADASAQAAKLSAPAGGGGGNAEASYNQGVIAFNAGKFAEARDAFEAATKADPNNAMAQYQLGMTSLNLGKIPEAVAALEAYLKIDPNGPKAAEVKASLPALQQMLKK